MESVVELAGRSRFQAIPIKRTLEAVGRWSDSGQTGGARCPDRVKGREDLCSAKFHPIQQGGVGN